jgi:hypothetical protein
MKEACLMGPSPRARLDRTRQIGGEGRRTAWGPLSQINSTLKIKTNPQVENI